MAKNLQELLKLIPQAVVTGKTDRVIENMAYDSRVVGPASLFVCLHGAHVDGHNYIDKAVQCGAVAVIVDKAVTYDGDITVVKVDDTRTAMQILAPFFYDYPSRKVRLIGVTGTNGKTTTTYLLASVLKTAGFKVGVIGTIQTLVGDKVLPVKNTTPDVIDLQQILVQMAEAGLDYVVMEVSSHALAMHRVAGCEFDGAIFTNLTQDHLDYHKTLENYRDAKALLFQSLGQAPTKNNKWAVVNIDDAAGQTMVDSSAGKVYTYSLHGQGNLQAYNMQVAARKLQFTVRGAFGELSLSLKITGLFNVYNSLAAIGAALAEKIPSVSIKLALEQFTTVPGRFEIVETGQAFTVIVDYAHTPDGLENILKTARQITTGRIITVFGCGGDRDRTKRPIMGQLAAKYSDVVIATSDNPRSEDPLAILKEVEVGILAALAPKQHYEMIPDRRQAIATALKAAQVADIVMIAGKGHETYQILKDRTIDFDDRQVVRELIGELK
jgi:UDP-N-acetylmuramoyl-L-alanyl-D-glutamate--2,6-diaminopimelate ligase